ncbi:hypothetical protein ABT364_17890 [Massilia sp. SR12]
MKKAVLAVLSVAAMAACASYSYARPVKGVEWDIVNASGEVIGGAELTCSGRVLRWGDQNGTQVEVMRYSCY